MEARSTLSQNVRNRKVCWYSYVGGAGMESEQAMIGDDDEVASGGSRKYEDDRVESPIGVAEAESKYTAVEYFYFTAYSNA
ncbi:Hypothetical predicted protein [Olea europaea subsp. europaea]|uniref:Uncharacterized protein n=1 Tax=Olea europaea subsp. europaea TaxID=158383 RepID=A0A8S0QH52_OLEEU|nr:Hypothetical predicted protein [Olea europaea subsp. europaea]